MFSKIFSVAEELLKKAFGFDGGVAILGAFIAGNLNPAIMYVHKYTCYCVI